MSVRPARIVLVGFSGSGKSSVAPLVAAALGWRAVDTDDLAQQQAGRPVAAIFRAEGETAFRRLETQALRDVSREHNIVISAGGGAFIQPENRVMLAEGAFVVCLEARPETILERLQASEAVSERPLLAAADPLARIRELLAERRDSYDRADATIHTDALTPDEAAAEVVAAWRRYSAAMLQSPGRLEALAAGESTAASYPDAACVVRATGGTYPLYVEWGAIGRLGERLREAGLSGRVFLISDDHVFAAYGRQAEAAIEKAGLSVSSYVAPAGEASKSLAATAAIYDWLAGERAERKHAIVALGGGVVTDLGGFVAATFARGLPLVHVPTSLLGMVDAAIGGKVAVNHREAKNLIGAFYQPRLVLADVAALRTLPARELTSGWAEVIKHAFIADEALLGALETQAEALISLDEDMSTAAIKRSMAIKADVVSQDEREETGLRATLNYGHTLAHGLETASGYAALLHGEAVAIGMMAAARISARLGLLDEATVRRQEAVLKRFRLPTEAPPLDRDRVLAAMALDKKVSAGSIRWVLLEGIGKPSLRDDVPLKLAVEVIAELVPSRA